MPHSIPPLMTLIVEAKEAVILLFRSTVFGTKKPVVISWILGLGSYGVI